MRFQPPRRSLGRELVDDVVRDLAMRILVDTVDWTPASVPANSTLDTVLSDSACTGLRQGMPVTVSPPSAPLSGLVFCAWVATDDTLTIRIANVTAGALVPPAGEWGFLAVLP